MVFRPATPGFVVTLAATICLALVSFGVPMLKSIYFLSATINSNGINGTATFGVLGYCLQTGGTQACSNATVGWEFNPNALLDLNLPLNIEIPTVVVKWLTYALVLHIVGLGLAGVSAVFGLLAHIREMAMTCFSSCFSGLAAAVVLLAFIFDLVFFFVLRTRIRAVGGTANLGTGMWLTLAAWVMLFFAGFFFGIGRCCFSNRPRGPKGWNKDNNNNTYGGNVGPGQTGGISHSEAMRMEAIKAEQERKARQAEVGLPAFPTKSESAPLKPEAQYYVEEDSEDEARPYVPAGAAPQRRGSAGTTTTSYTTNYAGRGRQQVSQAPFPGGYMQGAPGTRTVDQYGNPMPGPQRQQSTGSGYNYNPNASSSSPPPMPSAQQYLAPGVAVGEVVQGHGGRQTSYQSAVSHQTGQPSHFDQPYGGAGSDPYYTHQNQPSQAPQFPSAYAPPVPQQSYNEPQTGYGGYGGYGQTSGYDQNNAYHQQPQQPYADPYAPTRTYTPPQQQQQQSYPQQQQPYPPTRQPSVPVVNTSYGGYNDPYAAGEARRSPTSPTGPRGPRPAQTAYIPPPWEQGGSTNDIINNFSSTPAPPVPPAKDGHFPSSIPSDAPPSYDLPPGAAPPGGYPQEKR